MAKTKLTLTDTHLVVLSTASARSGLNLIPLPDCLGLRDNRIEAILDDLVRNRLAAEEKRPQTQDFATSLERGRKVT